MIRVALIAHLSEVSGAGIALLAAAQGLAKAGMQPVFILPGNGPLGDRARSVGVEPVIIENPEVALTEISLGRKLAVLRERFRYIGRLATYLRENADIACVNSTASVFAGLAARRAKLPIVWRVHELISPGASISIRAKVALVDRLAGALVFDSESGRKAFGSRRVRRQMVAKNGTDIQRFVDAARVPAWEARIGRRPTTRVIASNGMFPRKAPDVFLEAAAHLARRLPDMDLRFVLIGEIAPEWQKFAEKLHQWANLEPLAGHVVFTGPVNDMPALLASTDVYVSPSRNEALPISLVEAMAAGVPVVATDVGDCALLLRGGELGSVVLPEDSIALANALEAILLDPAGTAERAARARTQVLQDYAGDYFWEPFTNFVRETASLR